MRQVNFVFSQPAAGLLGISLRRIDGGEQSLLTRTVGAILVDIPPQTDYLTGMAKQARIADGRGPGAAKHVGERRGQFTVAAQRLRLGVQRSAGRMRWFLFCGLIQTEALFQFPL